MTALTTAHSPIDLDRRLTWSAWAAVVATVFAILVALASMTGGSAASLDYPAPGPTPAPAPLTVHATVELP